MSGTTSGTYAYNENTAEIIKGAYYIMGLYQPGETLAPADFRAGWVALNAMVKAWQASGIHLWAEADCILFLQPGQIAYQLGSGSSDHATLSNSWTQSTLADTAAEGATTATFASATGIANGCDIGIWLDSGTIFWTTAAGAPSGNVVALATQLPSQATSGAQTAAYQNALVRPLRVPGGRRLQYGVSAGMLQIETPLIVMSRLDYANVPNKTTPGEITQYFYDPQLNAGIMNVWPAPSDDQSAMRFTAQLPLQDFVSNANAPDLPQEWISTLRFNLAKEQMLVYGIKPPRSQMIVAMADEKFAMASSWDREPESVLFGLSLRR